MNDQPQEDACGHTEHVHRADGWTYGRRFPTDGPDEGIWERCMWTAPVSGVYKVTF